MSLRARDTAAWGALPREKPNSGEGRLAEAAPGSDVLFLTANGGASGDQVQVCESLRSSQRTTWRGKKTWRKNLISRG